MQYQKARLISLRRRMLGNQLGRQIEIKVGGVHAQRVVSARQFPISELSMLDGFFDSLN